VHSPGGWTYYGYDARGAVVRRHLPNDTCTYCAYDAAGRVTSIADRKSDGTAVCSFAFTRDPNGNILTSAREDGSCWYYEYDGVQRLTGAAWKDGATSLYAYEYGYDRVGNRVSLVYNGEVTYYSYNPANELTHEVSLGGDTVYYSYDGRGNQTERTVLAGETTYFAYNSRNLLTTITSTDPSLTPNTFEYNALGQRTKKSDSTGTTVYVWGGLNIILELDEQGVVQRRYTHGHTPIHGVFSLIAVQDRQGCRYCYHMDQVGGIHRLTDAWGNVIKTYEYSPYGRILEEAGTAPNGFVFPGNCLALADARAFRLGCLRLYGSEPSRWASRDPVAPASRYAFGRMSPLTVADPSSLSPEDVRIAEQWSCVLCHGRSAVELDLPRRRVQHPWGRTVPHIPSGPRPRAPLGSTSECHALEHRPAPTEALCVTECEPFAMISPAAIRGMEEAWGRRGARAATFPELYTQGRRTLTRGAWGRVYIIHLGVVRFGQAHAARLARSAWVRGRQRRSP